MNASVEDTPLVEILDDFIKATRLNRVDLIDYLA